MWGTERRVTWWRHLVRGAVLLLVGIALDGFSQEADGPEAKASPAKAGSGEKNTPRVAAKAMLMVSFDGKNVIYQREANQVRSIASLSKLMAALVVVERKPDLQGITTISPGDARVASGGCRTRLLTGMKVRNEDLLHAALLSSDNRAIAALGRAVDLSPAQLVAAMNQRARSMGLRHTRFRDPVGIDHGNVSTAFEVAKILRAAVLHPVLQQVMRKRTYDLHPVWPRSRTLSYYNTNALLHRLKHPVYGGKTGFNTPAGYCFASALRLPGLGPVLTVILGSSSKTQRFNDFYAVLRHIEREGLVKTSQAVARRSPPRASHRAAPAQAASNTAPARRARPAGPARRGPGRPGVGPRNQGSLHADSTD